MTLIWSLQLFVQNILSNLIIYSALIITISYLFYFKNTYVKYRIIRRIICTDSSFYYNTFLPLVLKKQTKKRQCVVQFKRKIFREREERETSLLSLPQHLVVFSDYGVRRISESERERERSVECVLN